MCLIVSLITYFNYYWLNDTYFWIFGVDGFDTLLNLPLSIMGSKNLFIDEESSENNFCFDSDSLIIIWVKFWSFMSKFALISYISSNITFYYSVISYNG